MKTKLRNLGIALVLAVAVIGVNASDFRNDMDLNVTTDYTLFDVKDNVGDAGTVVDIAVSNPDFSILVEAVTKADLAGALSSEGPFTVFAPTNDAFEALFKELGVDGISDLSAEQLAPILTYHVVSGKVMSTDLSNTSVETLNKGNSIKVDISNGVKINDSKVVAADIAGNNGVVHVIDKVLIPEAKATSSKSKSGC